MADDETPDEALARHIDLSERMRSTVPRPRHDDFVVLCRLIRSGPPTVEGLATAIQRAGFIRPPVIDAEKQSNIRDLAEERRRLRAEDVQD